MLPHASGGVALATAIPRVSTVPSTGSHQHSLKRLMSFTAEQPKLSLSGLP